MGVVCLDYLTHEFKLIVLDRFQDVVPVVAVVEETSGFASGVLLLHEREFGFEAAV